MIEEAEKAGLRGPIYEAALGDARCRRVVMARIENWVDGVEGDLEHSEIFFYNIANCVFDWRELLEEEDLLEISNLLRGNPKLANIGGVSFRDGYRFMDQPWWPS